MRSWKIVSVVLVAACGARTALDDDVFDGGVRADGSTVDAMSSDGSALDVVCGVWPMPDHDLARTSRSTFDGPRSANIAWSYPTSGAPIVGRDGTIYMTVINDVHGGAPLAETLTALYPNGALKWTAPEVLVVGQAGIGCDDTIYVLGAEADASADLVRLFAIHPDGSVAWSTDLGGDSFRKPPVAVPDSPRPAADRVLLATNYGLSATNGTAITESIGANGGYQWSVGSVQSEGFAIDDSGAAFINADMNFNTSGLSKFGSDSGVIWTTILGARWAQLLAPDGTLYVGASGGLYALSTQGSVLWQVSALSEVRRLALAPNGTLYFVGNSEVDAIVLATQTRRVVRAGTTGDDFNVIIDKSGVVYIWDAAGVLVALNPDDSALFELTLPGGLAMALSDHVLYAASATGLVAIGP